MGANQSSNAASAGADQAATQVQLHASPTKVEMADGRVLSYDSFVQDSIDRFMPAKATRKPKALCPFAMTQQSNLILTHFQAKPASAPAATKSLRGIAKAKAPAAPSQSPPPSKASKARPKPSPESKPVAVARASAAKNAPPSPSPSKSKSPPPKSKSLPPRAPATPSQPLPLTGPPAAVAIDLSQSKLSKAAKKCIQLVMSYVPPM